MNIGKITIAIGALFIFSFFSKVAICSAEESCSLDGFYAQLDEYLKSFYDPEYLAQYDTHDIRGHFSLSRGGHQGLYGSADMVYVLYTIDELDERTTPEGRREWAAFIQSCQDPATGFFTLRRGHGYITASPFKAHSTAYATAGLIMLREKPLYQFSGMQSMMSSQQAADLWMDNILWLYVWTGSHQAGRAAALEMTGEATDQWLDWFFDWLDKEVNPETALWQRAPWNVFSKKPLREEMAGAPHFWWVYYHRDHPLPYPEKIIDTCLSFQLANGLWDDKGKNGLYTYCIDLDAIWSIHQAYLQLRSQGIEYRTADITQAFEKYLKTACEILNAPGSLMQRYGDAHKLPGGLSAVAEVQKYFAETMGTPKLKTRKLWKQVLDKVSWL